MLLNSNGQVVDVDVKKNSKTHPTLFSLLREVYVPKAYPKKMFSIEERAVFKS